MRAAVLVATWIAGCAAPGGPLSEAQPIGVLSFDEDGRTAPIAAPRPDAAVWAVADPQLCFALEGALPARGAALDVLDSSRARRFQRVRCRTGTPLRGAWPGALDVAWVSAPAVASGRVALRFVVTEFSALRTDPEAAHAVVAALARELGEVGLEPELRSVVSVEGAPAESRFSDLDPEALDAILALAPPAPPGTVDVVFAGCLRRLDPTGLPSAVEGFTGRVGGGGGGAADALFLTGSPCDSFSERPPAVDPEATAHLISHELGHFLGLAHTEDELNTMHSNPRLATARGFTEAQARRMRAHPFVHAE